MLGLVLSVGIIVWIGIACFIFYDGDFIHIRLTAEHTVNGIAFLLLILTVYLLYLAHKNNEDLYGNFATSIGSIAVTVILIDRLNAWRATQQRKQEIFEEIESPVRDVAVEAVRLARKYGWLDEALQKVNLRGAQLEGANLSNVNLQGKNLARINLQGANLRRANLSWTNLSRANLKDSDLRNANFEGAKLYRINLKDSDLRNANFEGVLMPNANLEGVSAEETSFLMARMANVNLQRASLADSDLREANLFQADLQEVGLWNANFEGANLTDVNLQKAHYDITTNWPKGFNPEFTGAILEDI